ncbi:hypothetical protein K438DRAFT_1752325 [Mycena galopus ATCC 62051]|nr:hypothetical protein K438DRAFT_1752325 [Mycena galopus ATCC 62051]
MTFSRSISLLVTTLCVIHSVSSVPRGSSLSSLNRRQSGLPNAPQCNSTCAAVDPILENSCSPAQCCTTTFLGDYFNCLKCVGEATNAKMADWAMAQADLDDLTVACSKEGFTGLPELTLPTQNPNRTLSTVSGSQSSSHSLSQITIATPSNVPTPSNTHLQNTVTALPSTTSAPTTQQQTASLPNPTTSTSAAMPHNGGFGLTVGLLGVLVSAWAMI